MNPKTCWNKRLTTSHLKEPIESYHIVFKEKISDPTKTLKQISEETGISYDKIQQWSSKYFYRERLNAYTNEINERLYSKITNYKLKQIDHAEKNSNLENTLLDDRLYSVAKDVKFKQELLKNEKPLPEGLDKNIQKKTTQYFLDRRTKYQGDNYVYNIPTAPIPLNELEEELRKENSNIDEFLKAMEKNRE